MKSIRWMAKNHVAANLLMMFMLVGGLFAARALITEVFPEIELDRVSVTVAYPGAGPQEVEEGICLPIEEAISGIDGVKRVVSAASEGVGSVVAELEESADDDTVLQDIKAAVDRIRTFPEQAERPVVRKLINRRNVLSVVVYGDLDQRTLRARAEALRQRLLADPGITQVELAGVPPYEIAIEIGEESLRRYGLTLGRVADIIRASSLDLPGGSVKTRGGEVLLRTKERRYHAREYRDIVILTRPDGTLLKLGEIARVREALAETDEGATFQGKPAAMLQVYRVGDQSPTSVSATVKRMITTERATLPPEVGIDIWNDRSEILRQRMQLLLRNAALGILLVVLVLGLFLELRLAFWVTLGMPVAVFGSLIILPWAGVTVNMISLFAFILVLGIVVDDAIIVGENIHAHRQMGKAPHVAAAEGATEVGMPVIFSVLTTVAAFAPLLFVTGMMGKFMYAIPVIVIGVLIGSLTESLYVLPAHLAHSAEVGHGEPGLFKRLHGGIGRGLQRFIDGPYRRTLGVAIRYRYAVLALAIMMLMITASLFISGKLKTIFMPKIEGDVVRAQLVMPFGTPAAETQRQVARMVREAQALVKAYDRKLPEGKTNLRNIFSVVGRVLAPMGPANARRSNTGGHLAEVAVWLKEADERIVESEAFANAWRARVGEIAGAEALEFTSEIMHIGAPIDIALAHDDFGVLQEAATRLKAALGRYPGIYDITDSYEMGKPEMELTLRPEARALGLTPASLAAQVRAAFYGAEALRLQRGRDEVKVMVRYPPGERRSLASVDQMRIRTPSGGEIPFAMAARVREGRGYSQIQRIDRKRIIDVTTKADMAVANPGKVLADVKRVVLPRLMADYPGLTFDMEGEERERQESMQSLFWGFLAALGLIYALLAIPSKSYVQPLIIMSAIPFGIVGAVVGHVLLGYDLSLLSMFGVVAVSGVVVNDALVLVDFINRRHRAGEPLFEAVIHACRRRFRPVMLTTLTTFFALVPMISETSVQARFLVPMAISLAFGVLFATLITLVLVPSIYVIVEDGLRGVRWLRGQPEPERQTEEEPAG